jgi:hypothetical protein
MKEGKDNLLTHQTSQEMLRRPSDRQAPKNLDGRNKSSFAAGPISSRVPRTIFFDNANI